MLLPIPATSLVAFCSTRDLTLYLSSIWQHYFSDVPHANEVQIAYCRPWKSRLGLIRMSLDSTHSFIGINSLLQHKGVPDDVLITTIAHELVHYTHGFGSPLPQLFEQPHANNIVDTELQQRGLGDALSTCNQWIDKYWYEFYEEQRIAKSTIGAKRSFVAQQKVG